MVVFFFYFEKHRSGSASDGAKEIETKISDSVVPLWKL